jgi:hypothetical protein
MELRRMAYSVTLFGALVACGDHRADLNPVPHVDVAVHATGSNGSASSGPRARLLPRATAEPKKHEVTVTLQNSASRTNGAAGTGVQVDVTNGNVSTSRSPR